MSYVFLNTSKYTPAQSLSVVKLDNSVVSTSSQNIATIGALEYILINGLGGQCFRKWHVGCRAPVCYSCFSLVYLDDILMISNQVKITIFYIHTIYVRRTSVSWIDRCIKVSSMTNRTDWKPFFEYSIQLKQIHAFLTCLLHHIVRTASYIVLLHQVFCPVVMFQIFYNFTNVIVALGLLLMGLMHACIPWIYNYTVFVGVMFVCGISLAIINTGNLYKVLTILSKAGLYQIRSMNH